MDRRCGVALVVCVPVLVLLVTGLAVADHPATQTNTTANGTISGFVVENQTGNETPVRTATVTLDGANRSTDVDVYGFFEFEDLTPGTYTVEATAPGYGTTRRTVTVAGDEHNSTTVEIGSQTEQYRLRVYARGLDTGVELSGADVQIEGASSATTDADGYATVWPLRRGTYSVEIDREGYEPWSGSVALDGSKIVSARLHGAKYTIRGDVTGREDRPVDHGLVRVRGVRGNDTVVDTREVSLRNGTYNFTDLPPIPNGSYELTVSAAGYDQYNATVSAEPTDGGQTVTRDVDLTLIPSSLSMTVTVPPYVDRSGDPMGLPRAELILRGSDNVTDGIRVIANTTRNGTATFEKLLPGQYNLTLTRYEMYDVVHPPGVANETGQLRVVGGKPGTPGACQSGFPECKPLLRVTERQRSIVLGENESGSSRMDVRPERTAVELTTEKYTGEIDHETEEFGSLSQRFAPLSGAQVRFHLPPVAGVNPHKTFPDRIVDNASGAFADTFDRVFAVSTPQGFPNTTDDTGTLKGRVYPGEYVPRAIKGCVPGPNADCEYDFAHFYAVNRRDFFSRKMDVRVLENTTAPHTEAEQSVWMYPSVTRATGVVRDPTLLTFPGPPLANGTVTFAGDGWSVGNRSRYGDLMIPEWTHEYLPEEFGGLERNASTNASGRYTAVVPRDNYTISGTAPDYETDTKDRDLFNSRTRELPFFLDPAQADSITVTRDDVNVSTCNIETENAFTRAPEQVYSHRHERIVDDENLVPGRYTIYEDWESPKTVTLPLSGPVDGFLSGGEGTCFASGEFSVVGKVTSNETGEPLGGVNVTVQSGGSTIASGTSDSDGRFKADGTVNYPGLESDSYTIEAEKKDYVTESADPSFTIEGGNIYEVDSLALDTSAGTLSVETVNGSDGTPLGGARVNLGITTGGANPDVRTNASNGKAPLNRGNSGDPFTLPVPLGTYSLTVAKHGYYYQPNGTFTVEREVTFEPSENPTQESLEIPLTPLPEPTVTDWNASRPSSTDDRGLYLQGVTFPITLNATVETMSPDGTDGDPPERVALIVNEGDGERERRFEDTSLEPVGADRYDLSVTFDAGQLPPGRNNFTLVVETRHGAETVAPVTVGGDRYRVDVLATEGWLASTINTARPAVTFDGSVQREVTLPTAQINGTSNGYELTPSVTVTVDESGYPVYALESELNVSFDRSMPIDTLRRMGLTNAGIDGITLGPLGTAFDGKKRTVNASGGASLSASAGMESNTLGKRLGISPDRLEVGINAGASGQLEGEIAYEGPKDRRSYNTSQRFTETYSGYLEATVKAQLPLSAVPSVGPVLGPLQQIGAIDMFATVRGNQSLTVEMVYEDQYPMGLSWFAPPDLRPETAGPNTTMTISPEVGVGLLIELLGGQVSGSGEISAQVDYVTNPSSLPPPYLRKIRGELGASVGVTTPWPFDDLNKDWTLAQGLLWERGSNSTASVRPEDDWDYVGATSNRYWDSPDYDSYDWSSGSTDGTLVSGTFPQAAPAVAAVGDRNATLAYARDELQSDSTNTTIRVSHWNARTATWSHPTAVPGSAFGTSPAVVSRADGATVVAWRTTGESATDSGPVVRLSNTSVEYAVRDGSGWSDSRPLTESEGLHERPALASDGNETLAAWTTQPSGYPLDPTGLSVSVRFLGDSGPATVTSDADVVDGPAVALRNGTAVVAYVVDGDGSLSTKEDRELRASRYDGSDWSAPATVSGQDRLGHPAVVFADGRPRLFWTRDGATIRSATFEGNWTAPVTVHTGGGVRDLQAHADDGGPVVSWRAIDESVGTLQAARYDAGRDRLATPTVLSDRVITDGATAVSGDGQSVHAVGLARDNASSEGTPPDLVARTDSVPTVDRPQIDVSPTDQDFGTVVINTTATANLTVENQGDISLRVTNLSLRGTNASAFVGPNRSTPFVLEPDESTVLDVGFTPNRTGQRSATLSVESNDTATPNVSVSLAGDSGGVRVDTLSPTDGAALPGETVSVSGVVTNTGPTTVTETVELRFAGSIPNSSTVTLATGESTTVSFPLNLTGEAPGRYPLALRTSTHRANASFTVLGCGVASIANRTVTDLDGDGRCEDLDGDGTGGIGDALTYYNNRKKPLIRSNPSLFDFDGDGAAGTVFDAIALYEELSA